MNVVNAIDIFNRIVLHPQYQRNLDYGKPRGGHPEGTVRAHIAELENNLDNKFVFKDPSHQENELLYWKLRILIHVHDSFKADSLKNVPITHPQSHASLARAFLAEILQEQSDDDLLSIVQLHDEPYAIWRQFHHGKFKPARLETLLSSIKDWTLFSAFHIIDSCTAGKEREPITWFMETIAGKVESLYGVADIIPLERPAP